MRIYNKEINFGNTTKTVLGKGYRITDEYNDNNVRILHKEYDLKHDRFIRQDKFDEKGNPIENWWFEYSKGKQVEHFQSKDGESYVRTIINKIVDGLQVKTEEYVSASNPQNNYLYEITRNYEGKLLKFLCNGKSVF